ncbi:MAG: hypothetical protein ABI321_00330 [Polyangia bacterium]
MTEMLEECGSSSYLMISSASLAIIIAIAALAIRSAPAAIAALVLGFATVGLGLYGEQRGRGQTQEAVVNAAPEYRDELMQRGHAEAHQCVRLGYSFGMPVEVLAIVALVVARRRIRS